jgi:4-amino-4-deoxy-L-arabinose transferase-like glycosyltransferase
LAEVHGLFVPSPERNLGYPILHPLLVAAAYAPYMVYLLLTGGFRHPSGVFPFGLSDPVAALKTLSLIAHLVSALLGAGIAVVAYDAGCKLWDRRTGLLSAAFVGTALPMFYYSRTGNIEVPVLFFTAGALAVFSRCLMDGLTLRRAILLGFFCGCALAVKETALASFLSFPFFLVWFQLRSPNRAGGAASWKFWSPLLAWFASLIVTYGMGASVFLDPERYVEHIQFIRQRLSATAAGEIAFQTWYPPTWLGDLELFRAHAERIADVMTLVGALLAVAGLLWVLRREPVKALFLLPAVTYFVMLFRSARIVQLRYLIPVGFSLAFYAARGTTLALESRRRWVAAAFSLAACFSLGLGLLRGADLTYAMLRDSRYAAADWLRARTAPGDRVEYFGPTQKLPWLERGVITDRAIVYLGAFRKPRIGPDAVAEIVAGWRARQPNFILSIPDHSSPPGFPDSATCPPAIAEGLRDGRYGYRLVEKFETPPLLSWVRRPALDYPAVNPPIRIYARASAGPVNSP